MGYVGTGSPGRDAHPLAREALVERRALLRGIGLGAAAVAAGGASALLTSCGSSDATRSVGATTVPASTFVPTAYDPDTPYWLQGNYAPTFEETESFDLEVTGALPPALDGLYVRNGSNPSTGTSTHWFFGDGMLHGVWLGGGAATAYRNRYVRTAVYEAGGDFLAGGAPGGANNQSNVSVFAHGGRLLSSGEVGFPFEISTNDLSTIGAYDFAGRLTTAMTAHPKADPVTGALHFFGYGFMPPYLTYHVAGPDGVLTSSQEIAVAGPTMMHDFAITDRHAVFWEQPVVFDMDAAIGGSTMPFTWKPSYGSRIGVMPLGGSTADIRWVEIDNCYVFHGTNAYADGDDVILDVNRLETMFGPDGDNPPTTLHRWTIGTGGADLTFSDQLVSEIQMDLPTIDRRYTGRAHRHAWYTTLDRNGPYGIEFAGICRFDHVTGAADVWDPGTDLRAGEATFVADPGSGGEGEGWLLSYVYDRTTDTSQLVVLDALDVAAGPVATVKLPVRVPYGFHGWWVPTVV